MIQKEKLKERIKWVEQHKSLWKNYVPKAAWITNVESRMEAIHVNNLIVSNIFKKMCEAKIYSTKTNLCDCKIKKIIESLALLKLGKK